MKELFQILFSLTAFSGYCQYTSIPDPNFEQRLIDMGVDDSIDGQVLTDSISSIENLFLLNSNISDLSGIEDFSALKTFFITNSNVSSIDLSANSNLEVAHLNSYSLTNFVFSNSNNLHSLGLVHTQLNSLDLSNYTNIEELDLYSLPINSIDLSNNTKIKYLNVKYCDLYSINLFGLDSLIEVDLSRNLNLESLEFLQNNSLKKVQTDGTPLSHFDLSGAPNLTNLLCDSMQMISLDLSANPELYALRFRYTPMRYLDLSHNPDLVNLFCPSNDLRCLNIRGTNMYSLNTEMNPNLTCIEVNDTNYAVSYWSNDVSPGTSFSTNCSNSCTNAVNELETKEVYLVRIINLLGQKVKAEYNSVQIHEYSDGSTKKVFNLKY